MSPRMISRPYIGAADLPLMQVALIRGYDSTHTRIGDVAWRTRYHTHHELSLEVRLWLRGPHVVRLHLAAHKRRL